MQLLVVRHAVAEDRDRHAAAGRDDAARPLTRKGRREFKKAARGLAALLPELDLVASSRLARAVATAELLAERCGVERVLRLDELAPEADPAALPRWLRARRRGRAVAVVGHEPHLSLLVGRLLSCAPRRPVVLEKGGACLLELDGEAARLRWLLGPAQLIELGRR
jgi:phosphohistidine phosphatase